MILLILFLLATIAYFVWGIIRVRRTQTMLEQALKHVNQLGDLGAETTDICDRMEETIGRLNQKLEEHA